VLSKKNFFLFFLSILFVSSKWFFSFSFFNENIDVKIIFESVTDGKYYYPLIKYLAELNFNNSYDPAISNLNIIPLPVAGIIFHSLFYKIFGITSFIIIELFCIFIFLLIFKKIFSYFFSENNSILFSLLIFILPSLITLIKMQGLPFIGLLENNFYTLRVPRPMVSTLYFFTFIYLIITMYITEFYSKKNFISLGIIFGLTLSSFYYYFFIEIITFFLLIIIKFKKNFLKEVCKNFYLYALLLLCFSFTIAPFLINLLLHESDFTSRQCVFGLDFNKKIILTKHYLISYLNPKFLILFSIASSLTFIANTLRITNHKMINIFFIIFISSIMAPILFIIISNKSCVLYHFNNLVIVWAVIFFFIISIIFGQNLINFKIDNTIRNLLIFLFVFIYAFVSFNKINNFSKDEYKNLHRKDFQKITSIIKSKLNLSNSSLLTFDNDLMIWAIMNDVKHLSLINGLFTSKTDAMIEDDLIEAFNFLNLDSKSFVNFIKNKKKNWRYMNLNVSDFFFYKYQANSLITYKNSKDFNPKLLSIIVKSSPLLHQQSIIPDFEIERLKIKFLNNRTKNYDQPDTIVLNKEKVIFSKIEINKEQYCHVYSGHKLDLYISLKFYNNCV